ncbi:RrF2 family transcriptional regulator [Amaricoccus macauensis]|uniref:RrF2 family transcriptional regulator n=1 Tax=Amaricoccus macauensis TaxID=57001 RepID=UPI003C7A2969
MRLTIKTNIAMRTLMCCALNPEIALRKADIAATCNVSENHLAQVISILNNKGFLRTLRGRNGGVTLGRAPQDIRVGEVFRLLEEGVPFVECFDDDRNTCPLAEFCLLKVALSSALEAFYASLDNITIADLIESNTPLEHLLSFKNGMSQQCTTGSPRVNACMGSHC